MNENDLRVQRTRRLLQEALIELANQYDYEQITIRDITRAAQVGYKTFFRHYESKEALLTAVVETVVHRFRQDALTSDEPNAVRHNTRVALELAKENRKILRAILNSPTAALLLRPVTTLAYQDGRLLARSSVPDTLLGNHFATSMVGLLRWWIENEDNYSVAEMLGFIDKLLIQPIERL